MSQDKKVEEAVWAKRGQKRVDGPIKGYGSIQARGAPSVSTGEPLLQEEGAYEVIQGGQPSCIWGDTSAFRP